MQCSVGTEPATVACAGVLSVAPSLAGDEADLGDSDSLLWPGEEPPQDEPGAESPPPPPPTAAAAAAETDGMWVRTLPPPGSCPGVVRADV